MPARRKVNGNGGNGNGAARSPCIGCERETKNKNACCGKCRPLAEYVDGLQHFAMRSDDGTPYALNGGLPASVRRSVLSVSADLPSEWEVFGW